MLVGETVIPDAGVPVGVGVDVWTGVAVGVGVCTGVGVGVDVGPGVGVGVDEAVIIKVTTTTLFGRPVAEKVMFWV